MSKDGEHSSEQGLISARREKAAGVRARGENPFANDQGATIDIREARALAGPAKDRYAEADVPAERVRVRGRVIAFRRSGALSFLRLRDGTGEIQLLCDQATLGDAYARLDELDVGDIALAEGA